ncbi:hypothetical protein M440DRAFT_99946 [Trichoderma longibrachiatum ATCC 18648]|uniref:Uncharacterized protein n=1 Tax=Trichoderma longibrachiatum ATCC 18648 TaxID=983965 RepID=A0A2T4BZF3_TRILO|nr:hypothetical protein M440DRAFT_99946 [Trichoderma longibrachiatum ATCC 18648]
MTRSRPGRSAAHIVLCAPSIRAARSRLMLAPTLELLPCQRDSQASRLQALGKSSEFPANEQPGARLSLKRFGLINGQEAAVAGRQFSGPSSSGLAGSTPSTLKVFPETCVEISRTLPSSVEMMAARRTRGCQRLTIAYLVAYHEL